MKYFFKNTCIIVLTTIFLVLLFKDREISRTSIISSFNIWLNNLFPFIFPMIIINNILINYDFPFIVCSIFYNTFNKIFKLSYNGVYFIIMSLFIGTPTNAILLKELLDKKLINVEEANKLIYVCYFSNPLFLYNMLSLLFDKKLTLIIFISHYVSNFITLFIIKNTYIASTNYKYKTNKISLSKLISISCSKAINSLLSILGIISFYMLITSYINNVFISGLLEVTNGLNHLIKCNINHKELISIIFINFGGLSIFSQIKSILEDTDIKFINYFKGRLLQIIISFFLADITTKITFFVFLIK